MKTYSVYKTQRNRCFGTLVNSRSCTLFLLVFLTLFLGRPLNWKIKSEGENVAFHFLHIALDFVMSSDTTKI